MKLSMSLVVAGTVRSAFSDGHCEYPTWSNSSNCSERVLETEASRKSTVLHGISQPNLVFIMADQLKCDALGFIQRRMASYSDKLHVRTPHIDALAKSGVYFETAYCVAPSCAPSRAGIKTGCALQRTGVLDNKCVNSRIASRMKVVQSRIREMTSFEQILVEQVIPLRLNLAISYRLYYRSKRKAAINSTKALGRVIEHNVYSPTGNPRFQRIMDVDDFYKEYVRRKLDVDRFRAKYHRGDQLDSFSGLPYTPIRLDSRYGYPTKTSLSKRAGFEAWQMDLSDTCGKGEFPSNYSSTSIIGNMALSALHRLSANKNQPFLLSVHFNSPHPPMVASAEYFSHYYTHRHKIFVSPSIDDGMNNSAYAYANQRRLLPKLKNKYGWNRPGKIVELTASYYALIEEIDTWVGALVNAIDQEGIREQTMIIFTSDHGEMMGAHSMLNKAILLEEASRVPLVINYPGHIPVNSIVREPVSQMDLHATVLDYSGARHLDRSDGLSLRRFIEAASFNRKFDERVVVVELDERYPRDNETFSQELGDIPNFMVRKGNYKLMLTKLAKSPVLDMMYNLQDDPYEVENLLGTNGNSASDLVVGKAEHLKALLVEWMERMDGKDRVYSSNKYNLNAGRGDINEILERRTWRAVEYWESDPIISFGPVALAREGMCIRSEYFYVGRSLSKNQTLHVTDIRVEGRHSRLFSVNKVKGVIRSTGYIRIRVTLTYPKKFRAKSRIKASLAFNATNAGERTIPLIIE